MTSEPDPPASLDTAPLDLEAIQARCDAATGGPWFAASHNKRKDGIALVGVSGEQGTGHAIAVLAGIDVRQRHRDAVFVANARTDMPLLIERIRQLEYLIATPPVRTTPAHCTAFHRPDPHMKGFYVCDQEPDHEGDHLCARMNVRWPRIAPPPAALPGTADG